MRKKPSVLALAALLCFSVLVPLRAQAAKLARVRVDQAEVFEQADDGSGVITRLARGTVVATADAPRDGYYRMKSKTGVLGWIREGDVEFGGAGAGSGSSQARASRPSESSRSAPSQEQGAAIENRFRLRLFSELTTYGSTELDALTSETAVYKGAIGFGGEAGYALTERAALMFRVESFTQSVVGSQESGAEDSYKFQLRSMPVMAGLDLRLLDGGLLSLGLGAYGGLAIGTKFVSTNDSADNAYTAKASPLTALAKLTVGLNLSKSFALFLEGGYRYLKTKELTPMKTGSGENVLDGSSFPINLSGPMVGGGIALSF